MTFDELFRHHTLTPRERDALVRYLAVLRAQRTLDALAAPETVRIDRNGGPVKVKHPPRKP